MTLTEHARPCPECGRRVLMCDNGLWLEPRSGPNPDGDKLQVVWLGDDVLLAAHHFTHPRGHELHEHQPLEDTACLGSP